MDRQSVGLPQQLLEARGPVDAERQFDTVRQIGIVEQNAKVERLGAQRDRSADATQPDDPKVLHPEPTDHRMVKRSPRRRRVAALQFMAQQNAAAQGQRQRMVCNFGGTVIGYIADENVVPRQRLAVELVVADPHAHDAAQPRKAVEVGGRHRPAHNHQPVRCSAVSWVEFGKARLRGADQAHIGPEYLLLQREIGDLAVLGVKHGHGHRRLLVQRRATPPGCRVPQSSVR
jgi:hypothetical protein